MEEDLIVSVNTDDPKMFQTSLKLEYLSLIDTFDFSLNDIKKLSENAISSAWCDDSVKSEIRNKVVHYFETVKDLQ